MRHVWDMGKTYEVLVKHVWGLYEPVLGLCEVCVNPV